MWELDVNFNQEGTVFTAKTRRIPRCPVARGFCPKLGNGEGLKALGEAANRGQDASLVGTSSRKVIRRDIHKAGSEHKSRRNQTQVIYFQRLALK